MKLFAILVSAVAAINTMQAPDAAVYVPETKGDGPCAKVTCPEIECSIFLFT